MWRGEEEEQRTTEVCYMKKRVCYIHFHTRLTHTLKARIRADTRLLDPIWAAHTNNGPGRPPSSAVRCMLGLIIAGDKS